MPREPCQKGTSVLPVIEALRAHPDRKKLVPEPLWKYFDEQQGVHSGTFPALLLLFEAGMCGFAIFVGHSG